MALLLLAALATLCPPILAHGGLANYTVGETWYRGYVNPLSASCPAHDRNPRPSPTQLTSHRLCSYDPNTPAADQLGQPWLTQRQWSTIDPVFSVADPHLACNNPGAPPPSYISIAAGDNITAVYWYAKPGLPIPPF